VLGQGFLKICSVSAIGDLMYSEMAGDPQRCRNIERSCHTALFEALIVGRLHVSLGRSRDSGEPVAGF